MAVRNVAEKAVDNIIEISKLHFAYEGREVLGGVDLELRRGEWLAVLGANGSGKSTLARHMNGLLRALAGEVFVDGREVGGYENLQDLRRKVGIVFQNPDNQIVGNSVEQDCAFGPENLGVERIEMRRRVEQALRQAGLSGWEQRDPNELSGGQKQRLAIAGMLAMQPEVLILDEATSMLDPVGRAEVLELLGELHRGGLSIVMITHDMGEVLLAERAVVLNEGKVAMSGTPREIFAKSSDLARLHIELPPAVELANCLGIEACVDLDELVARIGELLDD